MKTCTIYRQHKLETGFSSTQTVKKQRIRRASIQPDEEYQNSSNITILFATFARGATYKPALLRK